MISNKWNLFQQICVDKEHVKLVFDNIEGLFMPKTLSIFNIESDSRPEDFIEWIKPYIGMRLVAKPTHSSGRILFLDKDLPEGVLEEFFNFSRKSFFYKARETQYFNLSKKIIIEENISDENGVNDYKFFCIRGKAVYLQIDLDRFGGHKRAILSLPEFEEVNVRFGYDSSSGVERPEFLSEMIAVAEEISKHFDFVRVNLYCIKEKIFFGECTFSPGAGADSISDEGWAIEFLNKIKFKH